MLAPDVLEDENDPQHVWIQVRKELYEDLDRIRRELDFTNINDVIALLILAWR